MLLRSRRPVPAPAAARPGSDASEPGANDLAGGLRDYACRARRVVQNRWQITAVWLQVKFELAYPLDTGHIGRCRRPDDHVYDYVSC
jgi:hypothetical protein